MKNLLNLTGRRTLAAALLCALTVIATAVPAAGDEFDDLLALIDTSRLLPVDNVQIPAGVFDYKVRSGWSLASLGQAFLDEPLELSGQDPRGFQLRSQSYVGELRTRRIGLLLMLDENSDHKNPVAGDESQLPQDTLDRLRRTGIDLAEVGPVDARKVLSQTLEEWGEPTAPEVVSHKMFVERQIGGIPVLGSRYALTYTTDFTLKKVLGYWPTMAADGHQLTSQLSHEEVAALVAQALVDSGETDVTGSIPLRFVYLAKQQGTRIRLDLHVEAALLEPWGEDETGEHVEKTRIRIFDVPAV